MFGEEASKLCWKKEGPSIQIFKNVIQTINFVIIEASSHLNNQLTFIHENLVLMGQDTRESQDREMCIWLFK